MYSTRPGTGEVQTEVLSSLGGRADEWDRLVDAQDLPSPFLKSWWIENACSGQLRIIWVTKAGQLIGGAAFETRPLGPGVVGVERLTVAGGGLLAPDHIDLIATPEDHPAVTREVLRWMTRSGNRLIDLEGLAAGGTLARLFERECTGLSEAPFAQLPADAGEYLALRPGKVRSTLRRRSKQLDAAGVSFSQVGPSEVDRALDSFSELHDLRWSDESGFLDAFEKFSSIVRAGTALGEVLIHELLTESRETVAIEVDFLVGQRLSFYQSGRRTEHEWRGCGSVLRFHIIEAAIERGVTEYDMLRGEETYKAEWATSYRSLSNHRLAIGLRAKGALAILNRRRAVSQPRTFDITSLSS